MSSFQQPCCPPQHHQTDINNPTAEEAPSFITMLPLAIPNGESKRRSNNPVIGSGAHPSRLAKTKAINSDHGQSHVTRATHLLKPLPLGKSRSPRSTNRRKIEEETHGCGRGEKWEQWNRNQQIFGLKIKEWRGRRKRNRRTSPLPTPLLPGNPNNDRQATAKLATINNLESNPISRSLTRHWPTCTATSNRSVTSPTNFWKKN